MQQIYLETTVISYLTSRQSRDLVIAGRQETTREWWNERRNRFELYISQFVLDEAQKGDPDAAKSRMSHLADIPVLESSDEIIALGDRLISESIIPQKAMSDAYHIAIASVHGVDILLTWNCTHIANGEIMKRLSSVIRSQGFEPPAICTPDELMGDTQ